MMDIFPWNQLEIIDMSKEYDGQDFNKRIIINKFVRFAWREFLQVIKGY
jgi:hypothetical protein